MNLSDVQKLLDCEMFSGDEFLDRAVISAGAADLMSDVLAFTQAGAVLLTGLVTVQTIQTADIAELSALVFVRGKKPDKAIIGFAKEKKIPLMSTPYSMYEACGILYRAGVPPTMKSLRTIEGA